MIPYCASEELVTELQCSGSMLIVWSLSTKPEKPAVTFVLRRGREMVNVVPPAPMLTFEVDIPAGALAQLMETRTRWSDVSPGGVSVPEDGVKVTHASEVTVNVEVVLPLE